ncbi:MAG: hypothetical protein AMXMBFR56_76990 [Polyangiaceae bacterium]
MESDWLKDLPGYKTVVDAIGNVLPERKTLKLIGTGFSVTDNPATGETELEFNSAGIVDWKSAARVVVTSALPAYTRLGNVITANANGALPSQDGVALALNDRLGLAIGTHADNGLWTVTDLGSAGTPFVLTRATDADSSAKVTAGMAFGVTEGTVSAGTFWILVTADPITLNTTPLTFMKLTGIGAGSSPDQILKWNGSSWLAGALNLAAAAAVSGILAVANGGTGIGLGAANTVLRVNAGGTAIESAKLTTANLDAAAGIVGTQLSAAAGIVGTQLAAGANIAASQLAAGGANTVLQGGTPNTWTTTPTVTSLSAGSLSATTYIALGADPADAGAIRLSHAMGVYGESNTPGTDRAVITWGVVANDVVGLGDAGTVTRVTGSALHAYVGAAQVGQFGATTTDYLALGTTANLPASGLLRLGEAAGIVWGKAVSGPSITHEAAVNGQTPTDLVIQAQSAHASSTGGARDGGDIHYKTGQTTSGGNPSRHKFWSGATNGSMAEFLHTWYDSPTFAAMIEGQGNLVVRPAVSGSVYLRAGSSSGDLQCNILSATGSFYITAGASGQTWVFVAKDKNIGLFTSAGSYGGGVNVLAIADRVTAPSTNPSGGGILYSESGNLFWRNSAGTTTQLTT